MRLNKKRLQYLWIGIVLIVVFWALFNLSFIQSATERMISILTPFILGIIMAFIINLPMKFIEEKLVAYNKGEREKWFRILTVTLSSVFILLIIAILVFLVLPDIRNTFSYFIHAIPGQVDSLIDTFSSFVERHPDLVQYVQELDIDWNDIQSELITNLRNIATSFLSSTLNYVPTLVSSVFDFVIAIIFALYLLFSKESLARQMKKLLYGTINVRWADFFVNLGRTTNDIFSSFFTGQVMAGVMTGIILYILMWIFNFPYRLSISVITGITTLIPVYGAIFGGVIGFLLISVVNFTQALWFVVLIVIVQQLEGNVLYPNVVGSSIGIPGIWIMVTVTIGGALFGFAGMFLSVPIFSLFYRLVSDNVNASLAKKSISVEENTII